jgi:hypothetical protein
MKKFAIAMLGCVLCAFAHGISPAYFGISGYRKSDGQFVSAGGTLTELQAASGRYYFGENYWNGALDCGNGGSINAKPWTSDRVMLVLSFGGGVGSSYYLDLQGKTSPASVTDSIFNTMGLTNVVVTWSMDNGLWLRFQNATKYDAVITDTEGGTNWTVAAGTGLTFTHRDYWAKLTVDTTGARNGTKLRLWSVDKNSTIAERSSFSSFYLGNESDASRFGRVRLDDISNYADKDTLLYSDMLANTGLPICGATNTLLYADLHQLSSNVVAWTEWQFDQNNVGSPIAYINDINVCDGHATTHIITHTISTDDPSGHYDRHTGIYTFEYTMSIGRLKAGCSSSEPCVYRTWFDASTFDDAESTARAYYSGTVSDKPKFTAKFHAFTGEWEVELSQ